MQAENKKKRPGASFFLDQEGTYNAFVTLFERRQRVQTALVQTVPFSSRTLILRMLGNQLRRALRWEWLIVFPTMLPFPQTSHFLDMANLVALHCRRRKRPTTGTGIKLLLLAVKSQ